MIKINCWLQVALVLLIAGVASAFQVMVDNNDPAFYCTGNWNVGSYGTPYAGDYLWASTSTSPTSFARWTPQLPANGYYKVYVCYISDSNRAQDAHFKVHYAGGEEIITVDQTTSGEEWVYLGEFLFDEGEGGYVELSNESSSLGHVVVADAVKFLKEDLDEVREIRPGITHIHRTTQTPWNINILTLDLSNPNVRIETCLANERCAYDDGGSSWIYPSREPVSSMVVRKGAVAGVNGDYWSGSPEGFTVLNGETIIYPRFRTAFGVGWNKEIFIMNWNKDYPNPGDTRWLWQAQVRESGGATHLITLKNRWDVNDGWMLLYTPRWGAKTCGNYYPDVAEVVVVNGIVQEVRDNMPGVYVPEGGYVLTGRGSARDWIISNIQVGEHLTIEGDVPDARVAWAVGAGPLIMVDGQYYSDPYEGYPVGEDFTYDWKVMHYDYRQPRTSVGVSSDGKKLVFVTVDGRQSQFSVGVLPEEMVQILSEFGVCKAMDLDSGGSTTMVIEGEVVNHPSDYANIWGLGGIERAVVDGVLIFYGAEVKSPFGTFIDGWNLRSVPIEPEDSDCATVFATLADAGSVLEYNIYTYDPELGYMVYPDDFTQVAPGQAYWVRLDVPGSVEVEGIIPVEDFTVPLKEGWNLFGNPYPEDVLWESVSVSDGETTLSLLEAEDQGWLQATAYYYNMGYLELAPSGGDDQYLRPWRGYWILTMKPNLELIIPSPYNN